MSKETILITGGTGKLGKIFVEHFLKVDWNVVIVSSDEEKATKFKNNLKNGQWLEISISDLEQRNSPKKLIEAILAKGIKINHLVNNARSLKTLKVRSDGFSSREDILREYLLDVVVPYELAMNLYFFQKESLETIVNIGSQYGTVAANPYLYDNDMTKSPIQYGLAKASVQHLTKELAVRFAKDDIRVNCVAYGGVEGRVDLDFKARYSRLVPIGRMLREEEVTGPLDFLLAKTSSSVTGHILAADGGWTLC